MIRYAAYRLGSGQASTVSTVILSGTKSGDPATTWILSPASTSFGSVSTYTTCEYFFLE